MVDHVNRILVLTCGAQSPFLCLPCPRLSSLTPPISLHLQLPLYLCLLSVTLCIFSNYGMVVCRDLWFFNLQSETLFT